jgi:hypothetical protein
MNEMLRSSSVTAQPVACQEGLSSMMLVGHKNRTKTNVVAFSLQANYTD